MNTRRKVYVLNTVAAAGANVTLDAASGLGYVKDGNNVTLTGFNLAGKSAIKIPYAAEVQQVITLTLGLFAANTKYTVIREANVLDQKGRDANFYGNTKKFSWTSPAVVADTAASKAAVWDAFGAAIAAKINADTSAYAAAVYTAATFTGETMDTAATLVITESAGYGLIPSYSGPASWLGTSFNTTDITQTMTAGKPAVGLGSVMLAKQAVWTLDKTCVRSGELMYNFDSTLPEAAKHYDTVILTDKGNVPDHGNDMPNLPCEIIFYLDNTTSANNTAFLAALNA